MLARGTMPCVGRIEPAPRCLALPQLPCCLQHRPLPLLRRRASSHSSVASPARRLTFQERQRQRAQPAGSARAQRGEASRGCEAYRRTEQRPDAAHSRHSTQAAAGSSGIARQIVTAVVSEWCSGALGTVAAAAVLMAVALPAEALTADPPQVQPDSYIIIWIRV